MRTQRQKLKLLLKLGTKLCEQVPRKNFDIYNFADGDRICKTAKEAFDCGYAGCALGWAPILIPESGYKLKLDITSLRLVAPKDQDSFDFAEKIFGLDGVETYNLFMPSGYPASNPTPKQVARKIIKLATSKLKELDRK